MRQSLIISMILVLFAIHVFSQQTGLSVKAGLNSRLLQRAEPAAQFENKFRLGIYTGVHADIPMIRRLTLQSELQYAMFGAISSAENLTTKYKTNYLLLPVMAKYNLNNGLSILCGVQAGALVSAKAVINGNRHDIKDDIEKTDFFVICGFDYHLKGGVSLGFRYQHGLRDLESGPQLGLRNQGFSMDVSYRFGDGIRELIDRIF